MAGEDDVPLAALAAQGPPKAGKFDDDTPLAFIAKPKTPAAGSDEDAPLAAKKPAPKRQSGGGAKGKASAKKKAGSSSSGSSSDSSTSDDEKKKGKATVAQKKKLLLKKRLSDDGQEGEEPENAEGNKVKKRARTGKEEIVAQLLCRWWYIQYYYENDWPPQDDAYYTAALDKLGLRRVTIQEWEWLPEEDEQKRRKAYELTQFKGLFRNSAGDLIDTRPKDNCPCYNVFMKKDMAQLCQMLISAYENQLKEIVKCKYKPQLTIDSIKKELTKIRVMATSKTVLENKS